jgi:Mg2+/Co2+ transporter CorC
MVKQHNIIHEYTIKEFNCGGAEWDSQYADSTLGGIIMHRAELFPQIGRKVKVQNIKRI